jgi:hypothetical protein
MMKARIYLVLVLMVLLALIVAFRAYTRSNKAMQDLKLPSGKTVKVRQIWQQKGFNHFAALCLDYQTDLKLADRAALREEADEVWSVFKKDVEAGKFNTGEIIAHEVQQHYSLLEPLGYRFAYQKQEDGSWIRSEDQKNPL